LEKPNYGGVGLHVFINLTLGVILLVVGLVGTMALYPLLLLLILPSPYFVFMGVRWMGGGVLEDRLRIRDEFMKLIRPEDGNRVLDVGTGGGFLAIGFAKAIRNSEIVGIDVWMRLGGGTGLENAVRNTEIEGVAGKVRFEECDARDISYPNDYFDIVVASFAIYTIRREREKVFLEMVRVLKPGGKFAIMEPWRSWELGWVVDERFKRKLEEIGLGDVKFQSILLTYPRKRYVCIVYGEKRPQQP